VQFNMGGIQVNADEMVKRLQVGYPTTLSPFPNVVRQWTCSNGPAGPRSQQAQ
jgi:hypothetical protein